MSFNIYEDQENRVPTRLYERGFKTESAVGQRQPNLGPIQNANSKLNILQNKRTVLNTININASNSSLRVQPRRAAKQVSHDSSLATEEPTTRATQGVSYETGVPHHSIVGDENVPPPKAKSFSSNQSTSSIPSFLIHEDSCSSTSSTSSGGSWPLSIKSAASTSSSTSSAVPPPRLKLRATSSTTTTTTTTTTCVDLTQSPVKNRLRGKSKSNECGQSSKLSISEAGSQSPPEGMDISMCEGPMAVDTPLLTVTSLPKEEILERKDHVFWDVPEYADDIYSYLREAEICHKPRENYMTKQTDITASMRWILVDWLVEVSEEYTLQTETLFLAVSYIDRFLSQMSVKRDKLQLVGTTAMFIASKYEEIYPPDVSQFAYITDNTYRVSQILRMEHLILKVLSFDMAVPTAFCFVEYFANICSCSQEILHLAMFLAELSMLDCDPFLRFLPSMIAASALALANHTKGREAWPEILVKRTKYCLDDLRECYVNLHRVFCRLHDSTQHAIRDKYKVAKGKTCPKGCGCQPDRTVSCPSCGVYGWSQIRPTNHRS